jgi:hypothetical protein
VHQWADELDAEAVTHEYAEAFKGYCTTLTSLTELVGGEHDLSVDQMDQLEAANARTLCEFYVSGGVDPAKQREHTSARLHV